MPIEPNEQISVTLTPNLWADVAAAVQHAYGADHPAVEAIRAAVVGH